MLKCEKLFMMIALVGGIFIAVSCNKQPTTQALKENNLPETFFAPTPLDGSMNNSFKLRVEWHGSDTDGIIKGYEYRVNGPLYDNTWQFTESFYVDFRFRHGWYTIEVRAKDNTGAVDPTPVKLRLHILGPTFDKGILIMDDESVDPNIEARVDAYYDTLMSEAGYPNYTVWDYQQKFSTKKPAFVAPPSDTGGTQAEGLGRYTTIIWYTNATGNLGLNKTALQDYLDMGGNLLIAGVDPLQSLTGESPSGADLATNNPAYKYFHVLRAKAANLNIDWILGVAKEYPDLRTSYQVPRTTIFQYLSGVATQLVPLPDARPLYIFSPNYYTDTSRRIQINSEEFAGTPCAVVYNGKTFNTALFGFPLVAFVRAGATYVNVVNTPAMTQVLKNILENEFKQPK
jgi:hypothetical protein